MRWGTQVNAGEWSPPMDGLRALAEATPVRQRSTSDGIVPPEGSPAQQAAVGEMGLAAGCLLTGRKVLELRLFPGSIAGGSVDFWSFAFRIPYSYREEVTGRRKAACVVYRLNIPLYSHFDHPYPSEVVSVPFDPSVVADVGAFFDERTAAANLETRRGAFIRINGARDHVQPAHYWNRHAWRALQAAQVARSCSPGTSADDVFWADAAGYFLEAQRMTSAQRNASEPVKFDSAAFDPDVFTTDWETAWPSLGDDRYVVQVDLVRWAFSQSFVTTCS